MRKADSENIRGSLRGIQRLYEFANGYGASVIRGLHTYGGPEGLWELAVLRSGDLCYTTPVTDDVKGYLTEDAVDALLGQIEALPNAYEPRGGVR